MKKKKKNMILLDSGAKGTIPKNYVCVDDDTPQAQDWWFASDRKNAEVLLLLPGNEQGTFLVRHGSGKLYEKSEVAVKTLKKGQMSPGAFLQEARTMHELRHPKLVQLLAVCTKGDDLLIVTEFMANGSLLSFLRKDEGRMVKYPVMINMAASGISHGEIMDKVGQGCVFDDVSEIHRYSI
nr:hypothetical protein BaRGS_023574 [Batillaria attramentaria]